MTDAPRSLQREPESAVRLADLLALGEWLREDAATVKRDLELRANALRDDLARGHDAIRNEVNVAHAEIKELIGNVVGDVRELDRKSEGWQTVHAQQHILEDDDRKVWREKLDTFLRAQEIVKAHRDGALGVFRYAFDTIGRNWRGIVALAAAVGFLIGNLHISFAP